jgi:hypothetical protein
LHRPGNHRDGEKDMFTDYRQMPTFVAALAP